jgi:hypothetical protein
MEVEESPIVVECEDDVLRLERVLMKCMGCQGSACAFLESVPYRQVRMELLVRLRTGSSAARPRVKVPTEGYLIFVCVLPDDANQKQVVVNGSFVMDVTDAREVRILFRHEEPEPIPLFKDEARVGRRAAKRVCV